jgi:hypothetical protein
MSSLLLYRGTIYVGHSELVLTHLDPKTFLMYRMTFLFTCTLAYTYVHTSLSTQGSFTGVIVERSSTKKRICQPHPPNLETIVSIALTPARASARFFFQFLSNKFLRQFLLQLKNFTMLQFSNFQASLNHRANACSCFSTLKSSLKHV